MTDTDENPHVSWLRSGHHEKDFAAAAAEIERLTAQVAELERQLQEAIDGEEAAQEKRRSLSKCEGCGCSVDHKDDVCIFHSPKLVAANARIAELDAENFTLAAGACSVKGGLVGDEGGTPYCTLEAKLAALTARAADGEVAGVINLLEKTALYDAGGELRAFPEEAAALLRHQQAALTVARAKLARLDDPALIGKVAAALADGEDDPAHIILACRQTTILALAAIRNFINEEKP